jgi:2-keto-4-pentenoate hydratase/2-oxohepta-3-ene-1,7-dioic acid hydratase in catechol pathway
MTKFVSFSKGSKSGIGAVQGDHVADLTHIFDGAGDLLTLVEQGGDGLRKAQEALSSGACQKLPLDDINLRAPITRPAKIIAIGLNYIDHCHESGLPVPEKPVVFTKHTNTIIGPFDDVCWRDTITQEVDYEVELGVVIGQETSRVSEVNALDHVFGYSVVNDVSARDLQLNGGAGQWDLGKSLDTFCPWGPVICTSDEIPDPQNIDVRLRLNGETRQESNTKNMIFSVAYLISYLSQHMTLAPGDLIATGTPPGVGMGMSPKGYMTDGDICETEIDGIGTLRNKMKIIK